MIDSIFKGLFDTDLTTVIDLTDFLLCLGASLVLGYVLSLVYIMKNRTSKSFAMTIALLPAVVCVVIMMVNGNVGTGVAVAGAFSLVRFRSIPGTAKEICVLFFAMGIGLITGMGYLGYATVFTVLMCLMFLVYQQLNFAGGSNFNRYKTITITIPEDLNYTTVFQDIFEKYTSSHELVMVKTTNMGSMIRCTYHITLRQLQQEKDMMDEIRCRNGNLEIAISPQSTMSTEL